MDWQRWIGFVAASALIGLVPGPGVMAIVGHALGAGRRVALSAVVGLALGNLVAMTLSLAGVGALLAASATAFAVLKWTGALVLVGLGARMLVRSRRSVGAGPAAESRPVSPRAAFLGALATGTFHPKTIVFFVAFAPQFIDPHRAYAPQAALLVATFCATVGLTDSGYAIAASRAARLLRGDAARRWMERTGGTALVAAGIATAATRA